MCRQLWCMLVKQLAYFVWVTQASSTPQRVDDTAKHARMITADDAQLDFQSMTASAVVQRHKAISHQVSY